MAGFLSAGDAVVIGLLIKTITDVATARMGRKVTIEDLPGIIADEEVRRVVLDKERAEAMATVGVAPPASE